MEQELFTKIHKYNPEWSQYLIDFINDKIEHLPFADDGISIDIDTLDRCVVGEVWKFTPDYSDNDVRECRVCNSFGMSFYHRSSHDSGYDEYEFECILSNFYDHVEKEHPELLVKAKK